ncbi:MAG: hypothetical protein IMX04_02805 [Candidatus Carbobacillus altaicus]|nr:hypothetical protein [Candidatus Carbobacillus altaicus]
MVEKVKEDRGAEAIEWLAIIMVLVLVVGIIVGWLNNDGKTAINNVFTQTFTFISDIFNYAKAARDATSP